MSRLLFAVAVAALLPGYACAQTNSVDKAIASIGGEVIRDVSFDICFPATSGEYEALGKNAIIMVEASSAVPTELPLWSVYVMQKGVRIPLHRVKLMPRRESGDGRGEQVSFYLLPVQIMKSDAKVLVDFTGGRKGFSITAFTAKSGIDRGAPSFVRLDEYDEPGDADPLVVEEVLRREYPEYIK